MFEIISITNVQILVNIEASQLFVLFVVVNVNISLLFADSLEKQTYAESEEQVRNSIIR